MSGFLTYWHTVRHLKPIQVYGRVQFHLSRPRVDDRSAPPLRELLNQCWTLPARRKISWVGPERACFLHETHELNEIGWDEPTIEKLWRYHLHYFDDLNAQDAAQRREWHRSLLSRWVRENPPAEGTRWEPHPTSLRIVNWIKWALAGNRLPAECIQSLAVQARWLSQRLEIHLLGNHLFANAKALLFTGLLFDGKEADEWLERGLRILERELAEQILPDGGHIERSPMYHSIVLEDLLDLMNLSSTCPRSIASRLTGSIALWREAVARMRQWLAAMCHPDREIAFFNDAAIGMAASPKELEFYAERLDLSAIAAPGDGMVHLSDSGYIRVQRGTDMVALLDVAPVGPDFLPGHAHADTLSFELSLYGQRVCVNSGTSCYGRSPERLRQRGTAAHNTVTLDQLDSSEVWEGFRVARRARPCELQIRDEGDDLRIACAHDGYAHLPGKPIHRREWHFSDTSMEITDVIRGRYREAVGRLFFSPSIAVPEPPSATVGHAIFLRHALKWLIEGATGRIVPTTFHPEFGVREATRCLEMRFLQPRSCVRLVWV